MYKIDYENLEDKEVVIKINKTWQLFFNKTKSEMKLYNKEEEEEIILDSHDDKVIYVKSLNKNSFISISLDKTIKFWNTRGSLISTFDLESDLLGINLLNESILLACKENTFLLSKLGKVIFTIEENVQSLDNIELWADTLHFLSNKNLIIYDIETGKKIIEFENQDSFVKKFKKLKNDNILTITDKTSLWNSSGELIKTFDIVFDCEDTIESLDHNLIVLSNNKIYVYNNEGDKLSSFEENDVSEDLTTLIKSIDSLQDLKTNKNNVNEFPHISSPFSKAKIAIEELKEQELIDNKKFDKELWDFFNRPLFTPVKKTLKKEENLAKKFIKKIDQQIINKNEDVNQLNTDLLKSLKNKKINKWLSIVSLVVTIITFGIVFGQTNKSFDFGLDESILQNLFMLFGLGGVAFLFFILLAIRANTTSKNFKNKIEITESEIKTLNFIKIEILNFISDLKRYRNSIIKQFPIVNDTTLFGGKRIEEKINNLLENEINIVAMNECGIIKDDIIHVDNKAIILNDWSLIQSNSKKINLHNMHSYWGINKKILFATQFIQYIFLTKDKIDVFNTHYDFIQNKFIRKEAHAFYYKDVTNITKKEIERQIFGSKEPAPATEITLKVSSGDSIDLTILNEETLITLNKNIHNDDNEEKIDELEKQREETKSDTSMEEDEKNEALEFIDAQINTLKSNASISNTEIDEFNKVDSTIQNIRAQIKIHKQ